MSISGNMKSWRWKLLTKIRDFRALNAAHDRGWDDYVANPLVFAVPTDLKEDEAFAYEEGWLSAEKHTPYMKAGKKGPDDAV